MNLLQTSDPAPRQTAASPARDPRLARGDGRYDVRVGCIGRGQAGKTALFRAFAEGPVGEYFPSGLYLDVGDPKQAAQLIRGAEETRRLLEASGLPPTLETPAMRYQLCEGDVQRVSFQLREVIGQVLTHTLPDSAPEQQARYDEYLKSLLDTHVLWTVIPCPPPNPTAQDRRRYGNDLRITSAYLREALRQRPATQPCSVALVISKIDALFKDEEDARAALTADVLVNGLLPLVNTIKWSERVTDAAIVPVTAFGFGNAVPSPAPKLNAETPADDPFGDELEWLLKEGASQQPCNLTTLVLWSLLYGLLHQETPSGSRGEEPVIAGICRKLEQDLQSGGRWLVPLKGRACGGPAPGGAP